MYPPPPPQRPQHRIPAVGIIVIALGAALFGCVAGAGIASSDPETAQPAAAPKAITSTVTVTATPEATPSPVVEPTTSSPKPTRKAKPRPTPKPTPRKTRAPSTDPRFDTCTEAKANGYGHYREGVDPEYDWYEDRDNDGVVCE